jgi:hypothetical protein
MKCKKVDINDNDDIGKKGKEKRMNEGIEVEGEKE